MADNRQLRNVRGERDEHRQKRDEGHNGVDKAHAHIFQRGGETHRIFLHTLRGPLDMTQLLPVRHIVFVHRGTPAKDVVADEEVIHDTDNNCDQRDAEENPDFMIELIDGDFVRRAERGLNQIVERCIPCVDRDADLHQKPGDKDD
ncbi:hypothetical protein D3C71_1667310 [compost metagenome]